MRFSRHLAGRSFARVSSHGIDQIDRPSAEAPVAVVGQGGRIRIFDSVGWWGITAAMVAEALDQVSGDVTVEINSDGGDVYEGLGIYAQLVNRSRSGDRVRVEVQGAAFSIASTIAMAGDEIRMHESARLMIHRGWTVAVGNQRELQAYQDELAEIDDNMAATYAARTGMDESAVLELMDAETYFSAQEAKAMGFVDSIVGRKQSTSGADGVAAAERRKRLARAALARVS